MRSELLEKKYLYNFVILIPLNISRDSFTLIVICEIIDKYVNVSTTINGWVILLRRFLMLFRCTHHGLKVNDVLSFSLSFETWNQLSLKEDIVWRDVLRVSSRVSSEEIVSRNDNTSLKVSGIVFRTKFYHLYILIGRKDLCENGLPFSTGHVSPHRLSQKLYGCTKGNTPVQLRRETIYGNRRKMSHLKSLYKSIYLDVFIVVTVTLCSK